MPKFSIEVWSPSIEDIPNVLDIVKNLIDNGIYEEEKSSVEEFEYADEPPKVGQRGYRIYRDISD